MDTLSCSYATPSSRKKGQGPAGPDDMQNRIDRLEGLVLSLMHGGANIDASSAASAAAAAAATAASQSTTDGSSSARIEPGDDGAMLDDEEEDSDVGIPLQPHSSPGSNVPW